MSKVYAKCYDVGCSERDQCLRWINRNSEKGNSNFSMFPYDLSVGMKCPNRLKPEDEEKEIEDV